MSKKTNNVSEREFEEFFRSIKPSEISLERNEIFYRDKYNEIMNYLKLVLTDSKDLEIYKFFEPKGSLLICIQEGSDIIDFIKLISSNYYLELYLLNFSVISKTYEKFIEHFYETLKYITSKNEDHDPDFEEEEEGEKKKKDEKGKKILLIEQNKKHFRTFNENGLLQFFIEHQTYSKESINFIEKDTILIWICSDLEEISEYSNEVFEIFDLFINIPRLSEGDRENILREFLEKHTEISFDINAILEKTQTWEVKDIRQLLRLAVFKQYLNNDLNLTSNEITDKILNLIEAKEFIPSNQYEEASRLRKENVQSTEERLAFKREQKPARNSVKGPHEAVDSIISEIKEEKYSDFMLEQFYENAASKNYNELVLIIDKLEKNEGLEENDRKILANYPFILNDSPSAAKINLEKAKKKIDMIKQAFGDQK